MELGRGGMATLYLARLEGSIENVLALKVVHEHVAKNRDFKDMFLAEARIAANIRHPNVPTTFEHGEQDGDLFIAMEYVPGESLRRLLQQAGKSDYRISWPLAVQIVADAAAGLHAAHVVRSPYGEPLHVVHRDVSPANILISYDGHVKVVDFGVALVSDKRSHAMSKTIAGKLAYFSPEQANRYNRTSTKKLDQRSDLFSLGTVLFETVCQKRLFKAPTDEATLQNVLTAEIPRPTSIRPELPGELDRIIQKALQRDVSLRYQTAEEMADDLGSLLDTQPKNDVKLSALMLRLFKKDMEEKQAKLQEVLEEADTRVVLSASNIESGPVSLDPAQALSVTPPTTRRPWLLTSILAVVLLALIASLTVYYFRHRPQPSAPTGTPPTVDASVPDTGATVPHLVHLSVTIWPQTADATLTINGKKHRTTSFKTTLLRSDKPVVLVVTAPGYVPKRVSIQPLTDIDMPVTLDTKTDVGSPTPDAAAMASRPRPMRARVRPRTRRPRRRRVRPMGSPIQDLTE